MSGWLTVQDVQLECIERGHGRPILWLHGEEGLDPEAPVLDRLAAHGHLLAPSHPGFGHSPEAASIDAVHCTSGLLVLGTAGKISMLWMGG